MTEKEINVVNVLIEFQIVSEKLLVLWKNFINEKSYKTLNLTEYKRVLIWVRYVTILPSTFPLQKSVV